MIFLNYYPQTLGIMDKLNEWNDKLNGIAASHMDNVWVGVLIMAVLLFIVFIGMGALKK